MGHPVYVLLTGSNNQFQNFEVANAFVLVLDTIQKSKDDIYINTGFNHQFRNYEQTYLALQIWFGNYKITNAFIILVLILKSFEFIVELITNLPIFRCRKKNLLEKINLESARSQKIEQNQNVAICTVAGTRLVWQRLIIFKRSPFFLSLISAQGLCRVRSCDNCLPQYCRAVFKEP